MAPRDIGGGDDWDEALLDGIDGSQVVVLVFSSNANSSKHVRREVHHALEESKIVIPLRIEAIEPARTLEYLMTGVHWLDALTPPLELHLHRLVERVKTLIGKSEPHVIPPQSTPPQVIQPPMTQPPIAKPPVIPVPAQEPALPVGAVSMVAPLPAPSGKGATTSDDWQPVDAPVGARSLPAPGDDSHTAPATDAALMKVALLYKRNAQPDEYVLKMLETELLAHGHKVFIDRHLRIGVEWAKEIERQVREADAVVPLLSAASVNSEMLGYEVQIAHEAAQQNNGKPRLLPVRVNYEERLPSPLGGILTPIQYALWNSPQDDKVLAAELLNSLSAPEPAPQKPGPPGGAVPLGAYYIVRPTDQDFLESIARRDSIVLVKGARQMGKTSLLARGIQHARDSGAQVVITDFQTLNASILDSIESLFLTLGELIADQLNLSVYPEDVWKPGKAPSVNFERYIRREVLGNLDGHLVWAMDEVDRLFTCNYANDVFGLFRTWHNQRAINPLAPWGHLTLAIVYATEAHLFISDPNQSPFNVGTKLELRDFNFDQVAEFNKRYTPPPLKGEAEVARFYRLVGGHPYLVHRGLDEMSKRQTQLSTFEELGDKDEGPFGDHLRRLLVLLARDHELCEVVRSVLRGQPCPTMESFYRLRTAGILVGDSARDVKLRCQLYATYLEHHLL
jgi:hypothetical protein